MTTCRRGTGSKRSIACTTAASGIPGGRSVVLGLGLLLFVWAPASAQFSAAPAIVELETGDSAAVGTIEVRNRGDGELGLRVYVGDFEQDEEGLHRFVEPGEHGRSCADRLHLFPEGATLQPGGRLEVVARLEPGPLSCWSVVFVESNVGRREGIAVAQRIAVKLYGTAAGVTRSAEVAGATATAESLDVRVRNTSDRPLIAEGEVEIRDSAGDLVTVVPVDDFSILPGRTRAVTVAVPPGLDAGRYLAIPVIDFGGDFLAGGQAVLDIPER